MTANDERILEMERILEYIAAEVQLDHALFAQINRVLADRPPAGLTRLKPGERVAIDDLEIIDGEPYRSADVHDKAPEPGYLDSAEAQAIREQALKVLKRDPSPADDDEPYVPRKPDMIPVTLATVVLVAEPGQREKLVESFRLYLTGAAGFDELSLSLFESWLTHADQVGLNSPPPAQLGRLAAQMTREGWTRPASGILGFVAFSDRYTTNDRDVAAQAFDADAKRKRS